MTQDELNALPDISQHYGEREEIRNGQRVVIPVLMGSPEMLWQPKDDASFVVRDRDGIEWFVGQRKDGTSAKRRVGW